MYTEKEFKQYLEKLLEDYNFIYKRDKNNLFLSVLDFLIRKVENSEIFDFESEDKESKEYHGLISFKCETKSKYGDDLDIEFLIKTSGEYELIITNHESNDNRDFMSYSKSLLFMFKKGSLLNFNKDSGLEISFEASIKNFNLEKYAYFTYKPLVGLLEVEVNDSKFIMHSNMIPLTKEIDNDDWYEILERSGENVSGVSGFINEFVYKNHKTNFGTVENQLSYRNYKDYNISKYDVEVFLDSFKNLIFKRTKSVKDITLLPNIMAHEIGFLDKESLRDRNYYIEPKIDFISLIKTCLDTEGHLPLKSEDGYYRGDCYIFSEEQLSLITGFIPKSKSEKQNEIEEQDILEWS